MPKTRISGPSSHNTIKVTAPKRDRSLRGAPFGRSSTSSFTNGFLNRAFR